MRSKLAGRLPLQEMIAQHIETARTKLAAAEDREKEKDKVKRLVAFEKKEHGHVPSEAEERAEYEKKGSAINPYDPDEVEKLAQALDYAGDSFMGKQADYVANGSESHQGGEQLPVQSPTGGKQVWAKGHSKKHQPPTNPGTKATKDNPGASNAMETDDDRAPGGNNAKQPKDILRKTAGQSVMERIERQRDLAAGVPPEVIDQQQEKKSSAQFIIDKLAEYTGGGERTPDDAANAPGYGSAKIPAEGAKLQNKDQIKNITKREAKAPRKRELSEVLTEPAMTSSTDDVVQKNLRNASKGGVKIAAAKVFLQKIAEEGCMCDGGGTCRHCKLKTAMAARRAAAK